MLAPGQSVIFYLTCGWGRQRSARADPADKKVVFFREDLEIHFPPVSSESQHPAGLSLVLKWPSCCGFLVLVKGYPSVHTPFPPVAAQTAISI